MRFQNSNAMHLRVILAAGYLLIALLVGGIVYTWLGEWRDMERLEAENREISLSRKEMHDVHVRLTELSLLGESVLEWDDRDVAEYRRHIHIFRKGGRHLHSVAKIWIERNGCKDIEIAESLLSAKENAMLISAIDKHWDFLNEQITRTFNSEKTRVKNIEK